MTKEEALNYLRTWPRWFAPQDKWVRNTLVRCGQARPDDTVTHSDYLIHVVPEHERSAVALIRQLCRIAGAERVDLLHHRARCGGGQIDKRAVRVIIKMNSELTDDDFFLRIDVDSAEARQAMLRHAWRPQKAV